MNYKLGDDEFPKHKKQLFYQTLEKVDYSSPVIGEWVRLAEMLPETVLAARFRPGWRRRGSIGAGKTSEGEKSSG